MNVPTDRRAIVKLQLRLGIRFTGAATRNVGGYTVMIIGEAKPADWPNHQPGDLEGMVWTTPRQVMQVVRNLTGQMGVIDVRGEGDP